MSFALLSYLLEHVGVSVAAVTGVLAARGKGIDLFGVMVLALVTAFGGGTLRDCTLGSLPVFWVKDPDYVYTAVATAVAVFFVRRLREPPLAILQVADAFALALFTLVGQGKALGLGTGPAIAIVMGVMTGVAGGILRDLLLGEIPLVFRPVIFLYATAAILGASVYQGVLWATSRPGLSLGLGLFSILALRLSGIRWRLSLPVFPKTPEEPPKSLSGS